MREIDFSLESLASSSEVASQLFQAGYDIKSKVAAIVEEHPIKTAVAGVAIIGAAAIATKRLGALQEAQSPLNGFFYPATETVAHAIPMARLASTTSIGRGAAVNGIAAYVRSGSAVETWAGAQAKLIHPDAVSKLAAHVSKYGDVPGTVARSDRIAAVRGLNEYMGVSIEPLRSGGLIAPSTPPAVIHRIAAETIKGSKLP